MVFPPVLGEKWRHSEHAPESTTGLSLFPPGSQPPLSGRGKRESRNRTKYNRAAAKRKAKDEILYVSFIPMAEDIC